MPVDLVSLLVIIAASCLAPILADLPRRVTIHLVVIEILLGILIGPQVLGLAHTDATIDAISSFGMASLFFLAGAELQLGAIRGRPAVLAGTGWVISVFLGFGAAAAMVAGGQIDDMPVVAVALATTALGVLLPVLNDAGITGTRLGRFTMAAGTVGELGPILLVSVIFAASGSLTGSLLILTFAAVVVLCATFATRVRSPRITRLVQETMHASGQLAVRLCMLVLVGLVALAGELGLDIILGAFAAGMIINLCGFNRPDMEPLRVKIQALAFGFFIPVFFIHTGMVFDLDSLVESPAAMVELPLFLVLFLLVRGVPTAILARRDVGPGGTAPLALFSATALPLVVAITEIGVATGDLARDTAASMVGAAMLSVLLFPLLALALRTRAGSDPAPDPAAPAG